MTLCLNIEAAVRKYLRRCILIDLYVIWFACLAVPVGVAQVPSASLHFDVASVKLAEPGPASGYVMRGGPGTPDPDRITWHQPLVRLIKTAYGVDFDQVSGPDWLGSQYYDIAAKLPPDTSREELKMMWLNLLKERFDLRAHLTQRPFPVYELSVAKSGHKLKISPKEPLEPGFPVLAPGTNWGVAVVPPRNVRQTFRNYSMTEFVQRLGWPLATMGDAGGMTIGRVIDMTGLKGLYAFNLEFAGGWGPGGAFPAAPADGEPDTAPSLFDAVRQQLGLQLSEKKAALDVVIVDRVNRTPSAN